MSDTQNIPSGAMTELRNLVLTYDVLHDAATYGLDTAADFGQLKTALNDRAAADRTWERMYHFAHGLASVAGGDHYDLIAAAREAA